MNWRGRTCKRAEYPSSFPGFTGRGCGAVRQGRLMTQWWALLVWCLYCNFMGSGAHCLFNSELEGEKGQVGGSLEKSWCFCVMLWPKCPSVFSCNYRNAIVVCYLVPVKCVIFVMVIIGNLRRMRVKCMSLFYLIMRSFHIAPFGMNEEWTFIPMEIKLSITLFCLVSNENGWIIIYYIP